MPELLSEDTDPLPNLIYETFVETVSRIDPLIEEMSEKIRKKCNNDDKYTEEIGKFKFYMDSYFLNEFKIQ